MSTDGPIRSKTLRDFLNDPKGPDGHVFFAHDAPFVRIDLFKDFYTLFWLGSIDVESVARDFIKILDGMNPDPRLTFRGSVSIMKKCEQPPDRYKFVEEQESLEYRLGRRLLSVQEINDFFGRFVATIGSVHLDLSFTSDGRQRRLGLWGDTDLSTRREKETGITSSFSITERVEDFLRKTSSTAQILPRADFDYLVKQIKDSILSGGYY